MGRDADGEYSITTTSFTSGNPWCQKRDPSLGYKMLQLINLGL